MERKISDRAEAFVSRRRMRNRRGARSESVAAIYLMLKGYRILGRRVKTPLGEIDLIVCRGGLVAFVEVKLRESLEDAESSISEAQVRRIHDAADLWLARNPSYRAHEIRFDVVFMMPWRLPRHVEDGL